MHCILSDDDDDYDGSDPIIVTESGDHQTDGFSNIDDSFAEEREPHVGIVHGNGDGLYCYCRHC